MPVSPAGRRLPARRSPNLIFTLILTALAWTVSLPLASSAAQSPGNDVRRGLFYAGLNKPSSGPCQNAFVLAHTDHGRAALEEPCTHGPDPAPEGVDVRVRRAPEVAAGTSPVTAESGSTGPVPCFGDGNDGYRVQLIYARPASAADQYPAFASSFVAWAGRMDGVFSDSAAETGGTRHIRFVTDGACSPLIDRITLSATGIKDVDGTISELRTLGYTRADRKYVVWVDANVYCGIAEVYPDDQPDPTPGVNHSNGRSSVPGEVARIDNGCWGLQNMTEAHELMHTLGGVQASSPNATPGFHCVDEYDRMCYADGSGGQSPLRYLCPSTHESLFDCNHDDYFNVAPPAGSYLSTHWNTASSAFIGPGAPSGPAPTTTTIPTTTTSTTSPATSTTTSASAPSNLTVTSRTASTAGLSWSPVAGASEYRAYVSRTSGSGYFLWASALTGTSATLYSLTGDFYVVLRAVVRGVESPNSNEVLASGDGTITTSTTTATAAPTTTTLAATTTSVPTSTTSGATTTTAAGSSTAPTNLRVTSRTTSTAGLSWSPLAGASEYRAYVSRTSGSGYFLWASGFTGTSATLYSLTGDFYVVVRAVVGGVESPNSNEVLASGS